MRAAVQCRDEQDRCQRCRVRARVKLAEEGEASTKYFFRLEKKRGADQWCSTLSKENGSTASSINGIHAVWSSFYSSLTEPTDPGEQDHLLQRIYCRFEIFLLEMGSLRSVVITLLFKKGDRLSPANWRPITLLLLIIKFVPGPVQSRLLKVIHHMVGPDQTCRVPGRFTGEYVALLRDLVHYCEATNFSAAVLSLDQKKAFLFKTLSKIGFGDSFIKWIRLL